MELKEKLVLFFVAAFFTVAGFMGERFFGKSDALELRNLARYEELYDQSAQSISRVSKSYDRTVALLGLNYGVTSYELDSVLVDYKKSLVDYSDFLGDLERYGTTGLVGAGKNFSDWHWKNYRILFVHREMASGAESRIEEIASLKRKKDDSQLYRELNASLDSRLEQLMQHENELYYRLSEYSDPVAKGLQQYVNYRFRLVLGLEATVDMAQEINSIESRLAEYNEFDFEPKDLPFLFAESRRFQSSELILVDAPDDDFFQYKNEMLAADVKEKFAAYVMKKLAAAGASRTQPASESED